jgi:hypothetical protein
MAQQKRFTATVWPKGKLSVSTSVFAESETSARTILESQFPNTQVTNVREAR